jgi:hypothetical protein
MEEPEMRKLSRVLFSSAAVALVSLALATTPVEAACFPAYVITFDELECSNFCHNRGCNYYYYPDGNECVCRNP